MDHCSGLVAERSLLSFPQEPVGIGRRWTGTVGAVVNPYSAGAIVTGKCTYELLGLASVGGRQWARISLAGTLHLPRKQLYLQKLIGIQRAPAQGGEGVLVGGVVANSPAAQSGILPGDVIVQVGHIAVRNWTDLMVAIALSSDDHPMALTFRRDNLSKDVAVRPRPSVPVQMEATMRFGGILVFDATRGRTIRRQIGPCLLTSSTTYADGRRMDEETHLEVLSDLVNP